MYGLESSNAGESPMAPILNMILNLQVL